MPQTIHADTAACPEEETLLAFVEGGLRGDALAALDGHLDRCALCSEVVAAFGAGSRDAVSGERARSSGPERAEQIGRFLVLEPIGEGAMGVVWAAYDPELDRRVAIKLLHAHRDDARGRTRLAREAKAMAKLSHPNVVTVYDVGVHADAVYVAMELVEGTSLRAWLEQAPRTREEVLEVFRQAGAGLAAAHEVGLVHRDFKPENVFVDRAGRAKVGDFGLARAASDEEPLGVGALLGDGASITRTGALLGTPAYMAPEQLAARSAGPAADQFAFCVALWEALAGARPFAGATTVEALRTQIAAGPPALPSSIPPRVGAALVRGLSTKPENRFPDLRALLTALAVPPSTANRRARTAVAIVVGMAIAVAAVAFFVVPRSAPCGSADALRAELWSEEARAQVRTIAPGALAGLDRFARSWAAGRVDACEDTQVRHEQSEARMDERVRCLDRARAAFGVARDSLRGSDSFTEAEILDALPDPSVCASLDGRLAPPSAGRRPGVEALRRAIDTARIALAAARDRDRGAVERLVARADGLAYPPAITEARLLRAAARAADAHYDDAIEDARQALFAAEAFGDDRGAAEAWLALTRVTGTAGRYVEAAQHARNAEAAIARLGSPADLMRTFHQLRGIVRTNLGTLDDAQRDLDEAMRLATVRVGAQSSELAPIHTAIGNLARLDRRFAAALAEHERALALDRAAWGAAHPRVARDLHNVAGVLRQLDRRAEARARYLEALGIERATIGESHPDYALTLNSLGLLAFEAGDDLEARTRWELARAIFEASGHEDRSLVLYNLALLELRQAQFESSATNALAAIAIDEQRLGEGAKRVGGEYFALGRARAGAHRVEEARTAFERARTIARGLGDVALDTEATAQLSELAEAGTVQPTRRPAAAVADPAHASALLAANGPAPPVVPAPVVPAPVVVTPPTPPIPAVVPALPLPLIPGGSGSSGYGAGQAWD